MRDVIRVQYYHDAALHSHDAVQQIHSQSKQMSPLAYSNYCTTFQRARMFRCLLCDLLSKKSNKQIERVQQIPGIVVQLVA